MSWLDDASGWLDTNSSWLKPVLQTGASLLANQQTTSANNQYIDSLKKQADQKWQNGLDAYNARLAYAGTSGGGSGGGGARNNAAELAAGKKANKAQQNAYRKALEMYKPLTDTANSLLPQMYGAYNSGLGNLNMLSAYTNSPEQMAKLNASIPAYKVKIGGA